VLLLFLQQLLFAKEVFLAVLEVLAAQFPAL